MTTRSTKLATTLQGVEAYDAYRWAEDLFAHRDYYAAAEVLTHVLETEPESAQLDAARELRARSYYHAALLGRAVESARDLVRRRPDDAYATLLLARSLERSGDRAEAAEYHRIAEALGAVTTGSAA